ncbi:DNA (cytosine-5-)-methyltransferase [uncultured Selenomonas sp.]|uniref:DNA (cytosine-5-)-methyltransferase n=1 Tax=uncultured Selenomonas sp. TaxID=159275 RepID=UPI0025E891F2|nr:DNA (cytosine-5-)-methyltransferase [uncultured Selenomonas sp.]
MAGDLTLGSLFDGSGGFPLGGLLAGIRPVWSSEIEPFAIRVTTKRLPFVKHYGDIRTLKGDELEPVDILTMGSPCQDISIAGRREGLAGSRSGLFYEGIRIAEEMRRATHGSKPRYIVWENVYGAFSSNGGADFAAVLAAFAGLAGEAVAAPRPAKWTGAGEIVGDRFSVAWRLLDAQYWGVPQRRRRVYLVANLAGGRAGKVLFDSEGVSGYSPQGFRSWQRTASAAQSGAEAAGGEIKETPKTLQIRAGCEGGGKGPLVQDDKSATLTCVNSQTLFQPKVYGVCSKSSFAMLSDNPRAGFYEAETARTLDTRGPTPARNQGGMAVVESVPPAYATSKNSFHLDVQKDVADTLVAVDYKDPPRVLADPYYIVRKLTPTECARLQGFPDGWCKALGTAEPTAEDIAFWADVFETYRKALGKTTKPKTERQIAKWLKQPHTDSAEYRLWGNGVALPCVYFVLAGIAWADGLP